MDGRSLLPFARNRLLHSGRDLLLETPTYAAVRSPNWLYAEHVTGERELYNLARDRYQLQSLHMDLSLERMKANLAGRLARLRTCGGPACRRGPQLSLRSQALRSRNCRRARVVARVGGPSTRRISHVAFYIDGHLLRRDRRRPFAISVPRRFAKPTGSRIEALVTLVDSRRLTLGRGIRGCSF